MNHLRTRASFIAKSRLENRLRRRSVGTWLILAALVLLFTVGAHAQDNATITGTVADTSGAVVPNAALTLTNPANGQIRDTVSNSAGAYRFANVGIGTYTLNATAQGFQKYTKTGIVVNVAQTVEADVALAVGSQIADRHGRSRCVAGAD